MLAFGIIEAQRTSDGIEHLPACLDRPALLEPRVPGDAYPGVLGDLLAAQPGRSPPDARRKPDVLRALPAPARAQELGELAAAVPGK